MASIHRKDGGWVVRWRDGERNRSRKCPDRRTAKRLQQEVERAQALGRRWQPGRFRDAPDLEALMQGYLRECSQRNATRTLIRKAQFLQGFRTWLTAEVGGTPYATDLSRLVLRDYHAYLQRPETGRHLHGRSPETCRRHLDEVERFWRWAANNADDYAVLVPLPKQLGLRRVPPPRKLAPTWADMDAAITACRTEPMRRQAVLMRCTGLRVGQVMGLRWDDFDLGNRTLHIRPELGKTLQEQRGRWVPLAPVLVTELEGWADRRGWVVPTYRKPGPREREARARDMARAWKRAGVDEARWRLPHHAFRAGFKSGLRRAGVPKDSRDYLVGHSRGLDEAYELVGDELTPDVDPLGLREAVAVVPPIGMILPLRRREEGA